MTHITAVPKLPPRQADSHKGTYGRVLVVAGSLGMSGAAVLTGSAALRGGAGLVTVACPTEIQPTVAAGNPCYTTLAADEPQQIAVVANSCDALAIGPGLSQSRFASAVVSSLIASCRTIATVLDADGLNVLQLDQNPFGHRTAQLILTPHPGEFARLLGKTVADVQADRETLAVNFAKSQQVVLLLKGHRTIVTDGERMYTNATGNPGMATGGSGDVLTGVIAALIAQKRDAFDAACLGAWVHGRSGDLAAAKFGQTALIASDLLAFLGPAFQEVES